MTKKAFITGITGQDGSYLAEFLLAKGYEVHGLVRRTSSLNRSRIDHLTRDPAIYDQRLCLHYGDMGETSSLCNLMRTIQPDEVYNLAAQSQAVWLLIGQGDIPAAELQLKGLRAVFPSLPQTKFLSARSPYGVAKVFAHWITVNYRESYCLFACSGILFNHESPRRGENFVTRKIAQAVAEIKLQKRNKLLLGNLDARRDWGYAPEYVEAMWLMLQQEQPADFVIATGETHSIREFLEIAFSHVKLDWQAYVAVDPRYFRPAEVDTLVGDATLANQKLGWKPRTRFAELVRLMVEAELKLNAAN
jgi:GDPmannose 4,6-dehydratase